MTPEMDLRDADVSVEDSLADKTIAVTGADGFVGSALCDRAESLGIKVVRIVRHREGRGRDRRVIDDLASGNDRLQHHLAGIDVVIHLAGRAHVIKEYEADPVAAFERANVTATIEVAKASISANVRRFVFVSSIGVNGSASYRGPFTERDEPAPVEAYAVTKLAAERQLSRLLNGAHTELVIVRPPLVYGPGAPGNFNRLVRLAASGAPMPLASISNRRNFIGVENLCDFLLLCAAHPRAAGELFLVAEPDAHTTAQLIAALARAFDRPVRVFRMPESIVRFLARLVGRSRDFEKLCGSLEVSSLKARELLGWRPRKSFEAQLEEVAAAFKRDHGGNY